jgi:hypothetical protein
MRLRQALLNLMSNANKFTERGTITIEAHQAQENGRDWITLSVADTADQTGNNVGRLEELPSLPIADRHRVNVNESERERNGIIFRLFGGVRRVAAIFRGALVFICSRLGADLLRATFSVGTRTEVWGTDGRGDTRRLKGCACEGSGNGNGSWSKTGGTCHRRQSFLMPACSMIPLNISISLVTRAQASLAPFGRT